MPKSKRNRALLMTGAAATAIALLGAAPDADAKSRRQISKPGDVAPGDRVTGPGSKSAPEIDPNTIAGAIALATGGLAVVGGGRRRRSRKTPAK